MPPHVSLLRLHSALASTTGDATKLVRNTSLFGATASTSDPDLEEEQQQILLSTLFSLKNPYPSISWTPYQSPSGYLPITAFFTITRTENYEIRLCLLSCPQPNGDNPCATARVSGLSAFTRTSNPMPPSVFTVVDIDSSKTVFLKLISHFFSAQISIGIAKKQALLAHFGDATFDAMRNVIPFRDHSIAPFGSPKRTRSH